MVRSTVILARLVVLALAGFLAPGAAGCKTETAKHKAAGNMHFNQGEYEKARDEYRRAVEESPDDPGAHTLLGNALIELGDYAAARTEFDKALDAESDAPEAHRGMMTVISHTSEPGDPTAYAEYLSHAEAIIEQRPKDKNAIIMAAAIMSEAANPADKESHAKAQQQAEEYLRRGLEIDDGDPKLLFHLALVYARKGEVDVATRVVERIRTVEPEAGFADYTAAIVYTITDQHFDALAAVEALLKNDSIDPKTLLGKSSYLEPLHGEARFQQLIEAAIHARQK